MKPIHLIPLAGSGGSRLRGAGARPAGAPGGGAGAHVSRALPHRQRNLDLAFALDGRRGQYYSTAILQRLERISDPDARILGVTACDLYVPVLTFVFGEAQLDGNCAVVSTARLDEEFYGLPPREDLLRERLVKEAVHELGHTFGLRHCADWRCVMTSSHAVERLDVKTGEFCERCRKPVFQNGFW